jgi:hypothetical protein
MELRGGPGTAAIGSKPIGVFRLRGSRNILDLAKREANLFHSIILGASRLTEAAPARPARGGVWEKAA